MVRAIAIAFEPQNILKLFLRLHLARALAGTALSTINQGDLTKGSGIDFGISSINFGKVVDILFCGNSSKFKQSGSPF